MEVIFAQRLPHIKIKPPICGVQADSKACFQTNTPRLSKTPQVGDNVEQK